MAPTPAAPVRAMRETPTRSSAVDAARKLSLARLGARFLRVGARLRSGRAGLAGWLVCDYRAAARSETVRSSAAGTATAWVRGWRARCRSAGRTAGGVPVPAGSLLRRRVVAGFLRRGADLAGAVTGPALVAGGGFG